MNSKEYLQIVNDNADILRTLIYKFHPNTVRVNERNLEKYTITAKKAEAVCEEIRKDIQRRNPISDFKLALMNEDVDSLLSIFSETWFGMPESIAVRNEPGFHTLCDLCEYPEDYE